jgi:hypothetical protein
MLLSSRWAVTGQRASRSTQRAIAAIAQQHAYGGKRVARLPCTQVGEAFELYSTKRDNSLKAPIVLG